MRMELIYLSSSLLMSYNFIFSDPTLSTFSTFFLSTISGCDVLLHITCFILLHKTTDSLWSTFATTGTVLAFLLALPEATFEYRRSSQKEIRGAFRFCQPPSWAKLSRLDLTGVLSHRIMKPFTHSIFFF